ncbi:Protein of unknown function [Kriegella aquimaris]|uniref:Amino acid permease n=2 Tax=Kriegella aquimaris TaxID=192904 RepID=A0A1G9JZV7_9FLAO|nr:Protein of unknown function [Kriegella aquimaris]
MDDFIGMKIRKVIIMVNFDLMENKLKTAIALGLVPQIIIVKWLGYYPEIIEKYYSNGLYVYISKFFRTLFGWIPFSVGDLLYFALIFIAIRYIILNRKGIAERPLLFVRNIFMVLSVAYFTFNLLWGLNYYRQPIAENLHLEETHSPEELIALTERLIDKTNKLQLQITADTAQMVVIPYSKKEIFEKTLQGYQHLEAELPFLGYKHPSIKKSLFSTLLTYMGYGGYLNPFTLEGQVNGRLPNFRFPVVSGHEIGHQVGYSAENETNFIGYLVTASNKDPYFQYSASAYALGYCLNNIKIRDEMQFELLFSKLHPGVRKNYQEMSDFWESFENPLEPVFKSIFNSFLKANNQEDGIKSYSKVVSLLVSYYKKHPL